METNQVAIQEFWKPVQNQVDFGMPYDRLYKNLRLLGYYIKETPDEIIHNHKFQERIKVLYEIIRKYGRKPNLCLYGDFDSGKSTLANILIGENILPTKLSPWTRLPTFVHHYSDKPSWMNEDNVWIFNSAWNPTFWMNQDYCKDHLLQSGDFSILENFVTHKEKRTFKKKSPEVRESYALIFIDTPILNACSLVDFPGFGNSDEDTQKAINDFLTIDVVFYLSTITGFMNNSDMNYFGQILDKIGFYEEVHKGFPTLGQLFLLATHCHPEKEDELDTALEVGAERVHTFFEETKIKRIEKITNQEITEENIRNQMFACWFGKKEKYENFLDSLKNILSNELPKFWCKKVDEEIESFKIDSDTYFSNLIKEYELHLSDLDKLERSFTTLIDNEKSRVEDITSKREKINAKIDEFSNLTINEFCEYYDELIEQDEIVKLIERKYPDKKEAKEYLPSYILELLQDKVKESIEPRAKFICESTKTYIEQYKKAKIVETDDISLSLSFDEVAAFSSGLIKLSSWGAIASLGLYFGGGWLAAHATGVLATIGTGMAGIGSAIFSALGAFLATITGPIIVGIIAVFAIISFWKSWKKELAKKVVRTLEEKNVKQRFIDAISSYWKDSKKAFNEGADEIESKWKDLLKRKKKETSERLISREEIKILLDETKQLQSFFNEIPWEMKK